MNNKPMTEQETYDAAVQDHEWLINKNQVARIIYQNGHYVCQYIIAKIPGWFPMREFRE